MLPAALSLDLSGRSLTRIRDWTAAELDAVLDLADELKAKQQEREPHRLLEGRTVGLLFRKHSTRTRVSLEVACAHLGATAIYLPGDQLQLARGESVGDTARVLSCYLDALAIRTHAHSEVDEFASAAAIPIVNALTDEAHPLQALADLQTIRERFGTLEGVRVAWVGDGNNVCLSLAEGCALLDAELTCASPPGYEPAGHRARSPIRARRFAAPTSSSPTSGRAWARRPSAASGWRRSTAGRSTRRCSPRPIPTRSSFTACRRIRARRSPPTSSTAARAPSGTRRRTACTRQGGAGADLA